MRLTTTTTPALQVPDVRVEPRPLVDAVAFPLGPFSFSSTSIRSMAASLFTAADADRDGSISSTEAGAVAIHDAYTSEHFHYAPHFAGAAVDATVTYDASGVLRGADANRDSRVEQQELATMLGAFAQLPQGGTFDGASTAHGALLDAFAGAVVTAVEAHGEYEYSHPW